MGKIICGIYNIENQIPNEITGYKKIYAGSSINLIKRKNRHFYNLEHNKHNNKHLQNAYNKLRENYNEDEVKELLKFVIVKEIESYDDKARLKKELEELESLELEKYKKEDGSIDHDKCYNIRTSSESNRGIRHSEEFKDKIRKLWENRSEEFKENFKGMNKGRVHTEKSRRNMSNAHRGVSPSKEHLEKLHELNKGNSYTKGRKQTQEEKDKRSHSCNQKKRVKNLDNNKIFNSIKEAAEFYSINKGHISSVCKGKRKTCGGYKWVYLDDGEV